MNHYPGKDEKPQSKPPTADDLWLNELREICARAIVGHIKISIDPNRSIKSLTLAEMLRLAEACTAAWIVAVSKKMVADRASVRPEYVNLLLG